MRRAPPGAGGLAAPLSCSRSSRSSRRSCLSTEALGQLLPAHAHDEGRQHRVHRGRRRLLLLLLLLLLLQVMAAVSSE